MRKLGIRTILVAVVIGTSTMAWALPDRLPEPTASQQAEAEKLVKEVYKDDYAKRGPDERRALAQRLLDEGRNTKSDPNSQYVLLREARDLATQVGEIGTANEAIKEMAKVFVVDAVDQRLKMLTGMKATVRVPEAHQEAAEATIQLIDDAMTAENFDAATKAAELAVTFATGAKSMQMVADAQARKTEIKAQSTAYLEMKIASDKLKSDPKDAAAKFAVGTYLCTFKNEWDKGLTLVAEGSDTGWAAVAKADIANPVDPGEMLKVADMWYDLAGKQTAIKGRVMARAEFWYNLILPGADGLVKAKVEKRLETIQASKSPTAMLAGVSDETRKLLPTQKELDQLKDACIAARNGNSMRTQEIYSTQQMIMSRLSQNLTMQKEPDFFARCRADLQVRRVLEQNGGSGYASSYSPLHQNFSSYAHMAKSKADFATRLVMYEKFVITEKVLDTTMLESTIYSCIRTYVSNNYTSYSTQSAKLDFCSFLKSKGVKYGVDRYKKMVETGSSTIRRYP